MSRGREVAAVFVGAVVAGTALVAIFQSDNVATGLSALFAFGLLVVAIFAARTGLADSRSRSRPMVGAELRSVPHTDGTLSLVIRNFGPSIARDVRVTFDPLIRADQGRGTSTRAILERYAEPVPVMMPGVEWDNIYLALEKDDDGKLFNVVGLPNEIKVRIEYRSDNRTDRYDDEFPLNARVPLTRTFAKPHDHPDEQAKQNRNSLRRLARATEKLADVPTDVEPHLQDRLENPDILHS